MTSSRKPFIAGNWKMNLDRAAATALAKDVAAYATENKDSVDVGVFPPAVYLAEVVQLLQESPVRIGAQNLHYEEKGAFTGELAASMIKDIGATCVLIGHSERRHVFGEPQDWMEKKIRAALRHGLEVIYCVGEKLEEREGNQTQAVIDNQLAALEGLEPALLNEITIAYEPVWAIGTGKNATAAQAGEVHQGIRSWIQDRYGSDAAATVRIQYGGSVKPENAAELMGEADVDGFLVGGASLVADKFLQILEVR